jgi:hypothetical protein
MTLTAAEFRKLGVPLATALLLAAGGGAFIWWTDHSLAQARRALAAAQSERSQNRERLARIAEEEREVKEKIEVYRQLRQLGVLGPERRLEWADAMTRIRTSRELLDLRYRVERQKLLVSVPGKPASIDFFASPMKVELALLHEGDLMRFLDDLRASGNAYYSIRSCSIARMSGAPTGLTLAPRLRAGCDIDLITVIDRGAKS